MLGRSGRAVQRESAEVDEARANVDAINAVVQEIGAAATLEQAVDSSLRTIRERFGWAYGSYWRIDPEHGDLRFVTESGSAGNEFRQVTLTASFREGVGLSGRVWKARDLVFVPTSARSPTAAELPRPGARECAAASASR